MLPRERTSGVCLPHKDRPSVRVRSLVGRGTLRPWWCFRFGWVLASPLPKENDLHA